MSCIRKLFSRKSVRSQSSETVLVTEQRDGPVSSARGPLATCVGADQHVDTESSCSDGNVGPRARLAAAAQRPASQLTSADPPPHPGSRTPLTSAPAAKAFSAPHASSPSTRSTGAPQTHSGLASHTRTPCAPQAQSTSALHTAPDPVNILPPVTPVQPPASHAPTPAASLASRSPPHPVPGTSSSPNVPVKRLQTPPQTVVPAAGPPSGSSRPADVCPRSVSCSFSSLRRAARKSHKEESAEPRVAQKQTRVTIPSVPVTIAGADVEDNALETTIAESPSSLENDVCCVKAGPSNSAGAGRDQSSAVVVSERGAHVAGKTGAELCTTVEDIRSVDAAAAGKDCGNTAGSTSDASRNTNIADSGKEIEKDDPPLTQSLARSASAQPHSETLAPPETEPNVNPVNPLTRLPASERQCAETRDRSAHLAKAYASDPPAVGRQDSCSNFDACDLSKLPQCRRASAEASVECSSEASERKSTTATPGGKDLYASCSWATEEQGAAKDALRLRVFTAHSAVVAYTYSARREAEASRDQNLSEADSSSASVAPCAPDGGVTLTEGSTERPAFLVSVSLPTANIQAQHQPHGLADSGIGHHQTCSDTGRYNAAVNNSSQPAIGLSHNSPVGRRHTPVGSQENDSFSHRSFSASNQEHYSISRDNNTVSLHNSNHQTSLVTENNSVILTQQNITVSGRDHSLPTHLSEAVEAEDANAEFPEENNRTSPDILRNCRTADMEREVHPLGEQPTAANAQAGSLPVAGNELFVRDHYPQEAHNSNVFNEDLTPGHSGRSQTVVSINQPSASLTEEVVPGENSAVVGSQTLQNQHLREITGTPETNSPESANIETSGPSHVAATTQNHAAEGSSSRSSTPAEPAKPVLTNLVVVKKDAQARGHSSLFFANEDEIQVNPELVTVNDESTHLNAKSFEVSDFAISVAEHIVDRIKNDDGDCGASSSTRDTRAEREVPGKGIGSAGTRCVTVELMEVGGRRADESRELEGAEDDVDEDDTVTVGGLLDVFRLDERCRANKTKLNSAYRRLRKEEKKTAILRQYVIHQAREQAELSRLIRAAETHGSALKQEKKNKDTELQKICDSMEVEDEAHARKHEPLMYKKYCAAKTRADAKTLLSTIRHRQRALHFLEAMAYRKCVALEHNLKIEMDNKPEEKVELKKKNDNQKILNKGPSPPKKPRKAKDQVSLCSTSLNITSAPAPLTSPVGPASGGSASAGTVALPSLQQQEQSDNQQAGHVAVFGWPSAGSLTFDEIFETEV